MEAGAGEGFRKMGLKTLKIKRILFYFLKLKIVFLKYPEFLFKKIITRGIKKIIVNATCQTELPAPSAT